MTAQIALLADGRLHLQHGPIDCLCRAWGDAREVAAAFAQVAAVFPFILPALCADLPVLRSPLEPPPLAGLSREADQGRGRGLAERGTTPSPCPLPQGEGEVARAMISACLPFADRFITPMAAVAGAVADHLLAALTGGRRLDRAFVNDGGDIAYHLAAGATLRCGLVADLAAPALDCRFLLRAEQPSRGIATSGRAGKGRRGRSFSRGIADAVTVLARTAAMADAAATVIANAVDLPGHPAITRLPACAIDPDSDLGALEVTQEIGPLTPDEIAAALDAGCSVADSLRRRGLIDGAVLVLRGTLRTTLAAPAMLETA